MPEGLDFIAPTMLRVVHIFHEHMGQEFNEGEVMRRAKIGKGSVNSVLRRLAQVGVTGRWKRGGFSLARVSRNGS